MEWRIKISDEEFKQCKEFAEKSAETQREHRSGGTMIRGTDKIVSDTLRGKMGEVGIKKFLEQAPMNVSDITLDFKVYPRGVWDEKDFEINGVTFSVKSSKHFSRYLLLEKKDISRGSTFDNYVLVLVNEDARTVEVAGFASKKEMETISTETLDLKKGQCIPNTQVPLDADNHARHKDDLHNSEEDWVNLIKNSK